MRRITKLPGKWRGMMIVFQRTFWLGARSEPYHGWKKPILVGARLLGFPHHSAKPSIHPVFNLEGALWLESNASLPLLLLLTETVMILAATSVQMEILNSAVGKCSTSQAVPILCTFTSM